MNSQSLCFHHPPKPCLEREGHKHLPKMAKTKGVRSMSSPLTMRHEYNTLRRRPTKNKIERVEIFKKEKEKRIHSSKDFLFSIQSPSKSYNYYLLAGY